MCLNPVLQFRNLSLAAVSPKHLLSFPNSILLSHNVGIIIDTSILLVVCYCLISEKLLENRFDLIFVEVFSSSSIFFISRGLKTLFYSRR